MANLTSSFTGSAAMDVAGDAARGALSAQLALSIATSAYDRAELLAFTSYTARTGTQVAGTNSAGEQVAFTGGGLRTSQGLVLADGLAVDHEIQRIDYRFLGGTTVQLTGELLRPGLSWPFVGDIDRGVVIDNGSSVTFTGVRLPPNDISLHVVGFDGRPVVGEGRISAIAFDKGGANIVFGGTFLADTESVDGQLSSTIEGTVKWIRLTYGGRQMTLTGVELPVDSVLDADVSAILALALAGRDTLTGTNASEMLEGLGGDDNLSGAAGFDTLAGGDGNDTLNGGADSDILIGGAGNDTYFLDRSTDAVAEDADGGIDHVILSFLASGADTLGRNVENGTVATRTGVFVALTGNELDNVLAGSLNADTLQGAGGADTLAGNAGNDRLHGGAGNDVLRGGPGGDTYMFGAGGGHDVIEENDATAAIVDTLLIEAGSGNVAGGEVRFTRSSSDPDDVVLTVVSGDGGGLVDTITIDEFFLNDAPNPRALVEQVRFLDGNVTLTAAQVVLEVLKGTAGSDAIRGTSGSNSVNGREGNDSIAGLGGNDTLIGHHGDDTLSGDAGADLLQGNLGSDALDGGEGNDILDGGAASDALSGGTGADVLLGGAGDDVLDGGAGLDTLTGGAGDDTLTGGADADRFVLNSPTGTDTITDFVSGVDKVAINKSVFAGITAAAGTTPRTVQDLGPAFAYDADAGRLTYDADGVGGADPTVIAQFNAGQALAADFLVIG